VRFQPQAVARLTPPWRTTAVVLGGCLSVLAAIHYATVTSIVQSWSRDPLAHGYFVVPATLYLAWARRDRLRAVSPQPAFATLALIALLSFGWLVGNLTHITHLQQACVVVLFVVVTWGILGTPATRVLMFPLGVLLFALPVGERVAPMLQELTARLAVKALTLSDVPAVLSGNVISIPGTRWHVSEACGGINYVTASLLVAYLYAGTVYREWRHRVAFLFTAAVTPIAGNLLRVHTTILLDYAGATGVASGMRHSLYGLLVFTIMMVVLFVTCGRWREEPLAKTSVDPTTPPRGHGVPCYPAWRPALYAATGLLLVASGPVSARMLWAAPGGAQPVPLPPSIVTGSWRVMDHAEVAWSPPATGRSEALRTYSSSNRVVSLQVASYGGDESSGDLVSDDVVRLDPGWWAAVDRHRGVAWGDRSLRVHEVELRAGQDSLLVWYWYVIANRSTGDAYLAKLLLARERLFRRPRGGDRIVVFTPRSPDVDPATVLQEFVSHLSLSASVPTTAEGDPY